MTGATEEWRDKARERFESLLDEVDSSFAAEQARKSGTLSAAAREQFAETLNQGLRRLRGTGSLEEAASLAVEISTPYAESCAMFFFSGDGAYAVDLRGLGGEPIQFSPNQAAAFQAAIESRDPVVALSTPAEVSPELAARIENEDPQRVYLFPLLVRDQVKAVLFASAAPDAPALQPAPLELIAGMTAIRIEALTAPPAPKRDDLLSIQGAAAAAQPSRRAWADLSPELQALHLRAQRHARVRVAQMRLDHGDAVRRGLETCNLYEALREPIDRAREEFRRDFAAASPTMVDYLYLDLVRSLAHDDDRLLGPGFPGPLI
jgi:hypothetical protein